MKQKLVEFEKDLLQMIKKAAKSQHISASLWIRQACREKLEREENTVKEQKQS